MRPYIDATIQWLRVFIALNVTSTLLAFVGVFTTCLAYGFFNMHINNLFFTFETHEKAFTFFMVYTSFGKTCISLAFLKRLRRQSLLKSIVFVFFIISFNEFIDEILFDPYEFQLNEVLLAFWVGIYLAKSLYANKSR